jgi:2-hydroxychromene-2-carboxylate isomerase
MAETKKVNIMPRPKAWDDINNPPLTAAVTALNPLEVYLATSFRSPYAYLAMDRYAELEKKYHVKVHVRYVYPVAIRDPGMFDKATDYRYRYDPMDMEREARFHGIPFYMDMTSPEGQKKWIDPVVSSGPTGIEPKKKQIHIYRLYRISTLIQTEHSEKSLEWAQQIFRKIYDGTASMTWPDEIPGILTGLGLDAKALEKKAEEKEAKYLAIVEKNQKWAHAQGHGGVPCGIFRGEPFWGQDRIQELVWRLKQNGLSSREPGSLDAKADFSR